MWNSIRIEAGICARGVVSAFPLGIVPIDLFGFANIPSDASLNHIERVIVNHHTLKGFYYSVA